MIRMASRPLPQSEGLCSKINKYAQKSTLCFLKACLPPSTDNGVEETHLFSTSKEEETQPSYSPNPSDFSISQSTDRTKHILKKINELIIQLEDETSNFFCYNRSLKLDNIIKLNQLSGKINTLKNLKEIGILLKRNLKDIKLVSEKKTRRLLEDLFNKTKYTFVVENLSSDICVYVISSYLDPQSACNFIASFPSIKKLSKKIMCITTKIHWKNRCVELGCDLSILCNLEKRDSAINFEKLAKNIKKLNIRTEEVLKLKLWMLVFLSESQTLVKYYLSEPPSKTGCRHINDLYFAARSGSVDAIKYVVDVLKINLHSTNNKGMNALHFAALSGSVEAIKYVVDVLKISPHSTNNKGMNVLYFAQLSGVREAIDFIKKTYHITVVQQYDLEWYAFNTAICT